MNTTEISSGLNWTSIFKAFHRTQMRLRRDRLKVTTTLREPLSAWRAAFTGRPLRMPLHSGISN